MLDKSGAYASDYELLSRHCAQTSRRHRIKYGPRIIKRCADFNEIHLLFALQPKLICLLFDLDLVEFARSEQTAL